MSFFHNRRRLTVSLVYAEPRHPNHLNNTRAGWYSGGDPRVLYVGWGLGEGPRAHEGAATTGLYWQLRPSQIIPRPLEWKSPQIRIFKDVVVVVAYLTPRTWFRSSAVGRWVGGGMGGGGVGGGGVGGGGGGGGGGGRGEGWEGGYIFV